MVTVPKLIDSLQRYVDMQIEEVARTNPMIGFMKPLVKRAADNAISKADKMLVLLADKDGNIVFDLNYTKDNVGQTYHYTITEVNDNRK